MKFFGDLSSLGHIFYNLSCRETLSDARNITFGPNHFEAVQYARSSFQGKYYPKIDV